MHTYKNLPAPLNEKALQAAFFMREWRCRFGVDTWGDHRLLAALFVSVGFSPGSYLPGSPGLFSRRKR